MAGGFQVQQFQGQAPRQESANVVQVPQAHSAFWGQVFPGLAQVGEYAANQIMGTPETRYNEHLLAQNTYQQAQQGAGTDNPEANAASLRADAARARASGRDADADALEAKAAIADKGWMDSKKEASRKAIQFLDKSEQGGQALINADGQPPTKPGQVTADAPQLPSKPGAFTEGGLPGEKFGEAQSPSAPQPAPTQAAAQPSATATQASQQEAPVHPLVHQMRSAVAALGFTPDEAQKYLKAGLDTGVSPTLEMVQAGKADVNQVFPYPLPGSADPRQLQVADQLAAQATPKIAQLMHDASAARAYQALATGQSLSQDDQMAMALHEAQAKNIWDEHLTAMGDVPDLDLHTMSLIAGLRSDPDTAGLKLAGKNGPEYRRAEAAYDAASPAKKVYINKQVEPLIKNGQTADKLQNTADALSQKAANEAAQNALGWGRLYEEKRYHTGELANKDADTAIKNREVQVKEGEMPSNIAFNQARAQAALLNARKEGKVQQDYAVANTLKTLRLSVDPSAEVKNMSAQEAVLVREADDRGKELDRLDKHISGTVNQTPSFTGAVTIGPEAKAELTKWQVARDGDPNIPGDTGAKGRAQAAQQQLDTFRKQQINAAARVSAGKMSPGQHLATFLYNPDNWKGNKPMIDPGHVEELKTMYSHAGSMPHIDFATFKSAMLVKYPRMRDATLDNLWGARRSYE